MRAAPAALPVVLLLLMGAAPLRAAPPEALVSLRLPFAAGTTWKIVQGYQGATHGTGPERYALDLVRADDAPTAGTEVYAPAAGTVWWMSPPGGGNGCLLLKPDGGGGLIVELCHLLARPFRRDERVEAGELLGTIGPAGTVGNNGLAHLHLSLHRTYDDGVTRIPAPFAPPDGLPLEGIALPPDGTANQYACAAVCRVTLRSTTTAAAGLPGPAPVPAFAGPAPAPATATGPAVPLRTGVVARVATDGDCLNVRAAPGIAARVLTCLADGTPVTVAQGPRQADGRAWWLLEGLGWAVGDYLVGAFAPPPALRVGGRAVVDAGAGDCLNLRVAPGMSGAVIACLPSGARLTVTDGPREADGHTWWQLDGRGWVAGEYLEPLDG
jgi:hypothetical protein